LIAQASAGLDASKTFDDLAHTSNPEVMSLLSKYFIGHLANRPEFRSTEISSLYDLWYQYLRNCVESLTTLYFEVNNIMSDTKTWFQGDLFNMGGVRKFYQFQSRLMQNGFSTLFGAKLQELHLKLTYAMVNSASPDKRVPDVIGIITRAQASSASAASSNEIAQIGQFVCDSRSAQMQENGILRYAQAVTELDVQFLEEIRKDLCLGMDAFDVIKSSDGSGMSERHRLVSLSGYLLSILERVAQRLETFFTRLARESIYRPDIEKNPARTRWNVLKRRIHDGSFFVLAEGTAFDGSQKNTLPFRSIKNVDQEIFFAEVVSQVRETVDSGLQKRKPVPLNPALFQPPRLADSHTARAAQSVRAPSSNEVYQSRNALQSIAVFMDSNDKSIKRLSQLPANLTLDQIMKAYGAKDRATNALPPLPEKEFQQERGPPGRNDSSPMYRRREPSPASAIAPLTRRGTNRSISSGIGLPSRPGPGSQYSSYPASSVIAPSITALASTRSRSTSRPRTNSQDQERLNRRQIPESVHEFDETIMPAPIPPHRKIPTPTTQPRLLADQNMSRSQSPFSSSSHSQDARFEIIQPRAANAPNRLDDQLLAQMQMENDLILNANGSGARSVGSRGNGADGPGPGVDAVGSTGLRPFRMVPPPVRNMVQI
jgi:hypothetical protein